MTPAKLLKLSTQDRWTLADLVDYHRAVEIYNLAVILKTASMMAKELRSLSRSVGLPEQARGALEEWDRLEG